MGGLRAAHQNQLLRAPVRHAGVSYLGRSLRSRLAKVRLVRRWGGPDPSADVTDVRSAGHRDACSNMAAPFPIGAGTGPGPAVRPRPGGNNPFGAHADPLPASSTLAM